MSNKALFVVLVICGMVLSALIVRNGKLLLLAIPFLVYLMIGLLQAPSEITLLAHRTIDKPSVLAQEPTKARIMVSNQGKNLVNLCLTDTLFPSMTLLDGQFQQRISLMPGAATELSYVFKAIRGVYAWDTIRAGASDPFSLFELERKIPATAEVLVKPMPMKLRHIPLRPQYTLHAAGPISARLAGSGTDFFGIREYRSGDSLRRINWRLAARHRRKLFTNEYEREEIADFGLILDARKLTKEDGLEEALFEYSISAIASLSEIILKEGNRVALLIYGESVTSLFPGYGKKQLNLVSRNLARATLGLNLSFRYLEYFPARLFPSRSIIVMFSIVDSHDLETYARLRSFGYEVLLVSPDPVEYAARNLPPTEINSLAIRAAQVERAIQLKQLMRLGVQVVDWQVSEPFERIVRTNPRFLNHRRNID